MRYPTDQKQATHEKLVRASAAVAKASGFAASGVDALARAAGLTSGAFYKHFPGKETLLAAICETELKATEARFARLEPRSKEQVLLGLDAYLSLAHVRNPHAGCVLSTLAPEVARAGTSTRAAMERGLDGLVHVLTEHVGSRPHALALVALCVGAVSVARALANEDAQQELLAAARGAVRSLLGVQ